MLNKRLGVDSFSSLVVPRVVAFVDEIQAKFLDHPVDSIDGAQQHGETNSLFGQLSCSPKNRFVVALREHDTLALAFDLVDHLAHHRIGFSKPGFEFFLVDFNIKRVGGHARYAFVNGCLRYGGGLPDQHPPVKRFGNDVFRAVLHRYTVIGFRNIIGNGFLGQGCQRTSGRHFHVLCDVPGPDIKGASEDVREPEHVVHLICIVGASSGNDGVLAHRQDFLGKNLRRGVGQSEHDRSVRHAGDHFLGDQTASGQAEHHVSAHQCIGQIARFSVLGEGCFVFVDLSVSQPLLGHDAFAVDQRDVGHVHTDGDVMRCASQC